MYLTKTARELERRKSADTVRRIAASIWERETWDELPILADALEDEGQRPDLVNLFRNYTQTDARYLELGRERGLIDLRLDQWRPFVENQAEREDLIEREQYLTTEMYRYWVAMDNTHRMVARLGGV